MIVDTMPEPSTPGTDQRRMDGTVASHSNDKSGITLAQGTALYVGGVLGAGILTLPALAAGRAGPASLVALTSVLLLSVPLASTFAALGARYPDAGGVSTFVRHAFGTLPSRIVGVWFYLGVPMGIAALGLFAGGYVEAIIGGNRTTQVATAAVMIAVAGVSNIAGLRASSQIQLLVTFALMLIVVAALALSAHEIKGSNFSPVAPAGWSAVVPAAFLFVWSFTGWEAVSHLAGEFRRPDRDIVRATGLAIAIVAALFLAAGVVVVGVLGSAAGDSDAPMTDVLRRSVGGAGGLIVALMAVLLIFGNINAYMASLAKLGAALGRDGAMPRWFARGSERGQAPQRSLAVVVAISAGTLVIAAISNWSPVGLVLATSASQLAVYIAGCAAGTRLLDRWTPGWCAAVVALVFVAALTLAAGRYLVTPIALALVTALWSRVSQARTRTDTDGRPELRAVEASEPGTRALAEGSE